MIEASPIAWALLFGVIAAASIAGLSLTRLIQWRPASVAAGVPIAFGVAISPLLLGLATVVPLAVLPGAEHGLHLAVVCGLLVGAFLLGKFLGRPIPSVAKTSRVSASGYVWVLRTLLFAWVAGLIIDSVFIPLTQNDSLEYAIVGRLLFELRDLSAYPALDPNVGSSGFYGPWTHPPLYVALIYLTNVLQGGSEAPGLMRAIAPWCALGSTAVVFTLGSVASRSIGLAAAVLFLSTPLYFLGAGSALIDPLPVLGMTVLLAAVVAIGGPLLSRACGVGLVMGVALWTHSQAILLIPLGVVAVVCARGLYHPRAVAAEVTLVLASAMGVGAWPYLRNAFLFGSAISDNPPVFAMPELEWPAYFSMARGIATWPDKLQYGLFKGWFAVEAYAMLFWLGLLGLVLLLGRRARSAGMHSTAPNSHRLWLIVVGVLVAYMMGVAISIAAGMDLMIRNERYLLLMLPIMALLGAQGLTSFFGTPRSVMAIETVKGIFVCALIGQLFFIAAHRWRTLDSPTAFAVGSFNAKLRTHPAYNAAAYMRDNIPANALVLSARPADMYYAARRMVSFIDPRLMPFYREANVAMAFGILQRLGITHVHAPDYLLPPVYNSTLLEILARSDLSRLLFSENGYQVYELAPSENNALGSSVDVSPDISPWIEKQQLVVGARKDVVRVTYNIRPLAPDGVSKMGTSFPMFLRQRSSMVSSTPLPCEKAAVDRALSVHESAYRLELDLTGKAFVHVVLLQFDPAASLMRRTLLGDIAILRFSQSGVSFSRRFVLDPECSTFSVAIEHRGRSEVRINKATLQRLAPGNFH